MYKKEVVVEKLKTYEVPVDIRISVRVTSADPLRVTQRAIAAIQHVALDKSLAVGSKITSMEFLGEPVEIKA